MFENIDSQRNLVGAWRLMAGKADGVKLLDISADGFWNSFFAILIALPALALNWVTFANDLGGDGVTAGARTGIVARMAIVDIGAWVLPLVILALFARPAGIGDRYVHYVVASNWASVILVWMMLPVALLRLLAPDAVDFASLLSLALFGVSMALTWRLTNAVIAKGPALGTAVFAGMFIASLATLFGLQSLVGLSMG